MSVGQVLIAIFTIACSGGAAFLGARVTKRASELQDQRERAKVASDRVDRLVAMTCSTNPVEAWLGLYHLRRASSDWYDDPKERVYIKRTLEALNSRRSEAYRQIADKSGPPDADDDPVIRGGS